MFHRRIFIDLSVKSLVLSSICQYATQTLTNQRRFTDLLQICHKEAVFHISFSKIVCSAMSNIPNIHNISKKCQGSDIVSVTFDTFETLDTFVTSHFLTSLTFQRNARDVRKCEESVKIMIDVWKIFEMAEMSGMYS